MAYSLTSKSQVTLPKAIRDYLKVSPGDAVVFRIVADGSVRVEPSRPPAPAERRRLASARSRFEKLRGSGGAGAAAGTDALMRLLRGYDEDSADPGFAPSATAARTR